MRAKTIILFNSLIFLLLLCSCSREFSKYQKTGDNYLEENHYLGNVKSVTFFSGKHIECVLKFNKYGFPTKVVNNKGRVDEEKATLTYNEFGKISRLEITDPKCHKADITLYDEYGNATEEFTEIYEVFDSNSDMVVGKKLNYTYENNYDKIGGLISRKRLRRNGSCESEEHFNQEGKLSKLIEYDDEGSVESYTDYLYSNNVLAVEKTTFPNQEILYSIDYYDEKGNRIRSESFYENGSIYSKRDYINNYKGYIIKEIFTYRVNSKLAQTSNLNVGDICHKVKDYERDEHGNILKCTTTTYYPNEDMSKPKKADKIMEYQYKYDSHGNVIYKKVINDGIKVNENRKKITYY